MNNNLNYQEEFILNIYGDAALHLGLDRNFTVPIPPIWIVLV